MAWGDRWEVYNWGSFGDFGAAQGQSYPYSGSQFSTPSGLDLAQPSLLTTPVLDFVKSSTCGAATLHVDSQGRLYANGESHSSTRNLLSNSRVATPTQLIGGSILSSTVITDVSCGGECFDTLPDPNNQLLHGAMLALDSTGRVHGWARNEYGQLGNGAAGLVSNPVVVWDPVARGSTAAAISSGRDHCVLLDTLGRVWTAGRNNHGQLGRGAIGVNSPTWGQVTLSGTPVAVKASNMFTLALMADGTVFGWGINDNNQLGTSVAFGSETITPTLLDLLSQIIAIDAYHQWSWFLDSSGTIWWWGASTAFNWRSANSDYGFGGPGKVVLDFTIDGSGNMLPVDPPTKWFVKLASGGGNDLIFDYGFGAIGSDEKLYVWGHTTHRRLGLGEDRPGTGPLQDATVPREIVPLSKIINYTFAPATHVANCESDFLAWWPIKSGEVVTGKTRVNSLARRVTDDDSAWLYTVTGIAGPVGGLEDTLLEGPPQGQPGGPYGYRKHFNANTVGRLGLVHIRLLTNDALSSPQLHSAALDNPLPLTIGGLSAGGVRTWTAPPFGTGGGGFTAVPVIDSAGDNLLSGSYTVTLLVESGRPSAKALELWNGTSNDAPPSGWETLDFDDGGWPFAQSAVAESGFIPPGRFIAPTGTPPSNTREFLTRQKFVVGDLPLAGLMLRVGVDDATNAIYVNGFAVPGGALAPFGGVLTVPASYFVEGINVIATWVRNINPTKNGIGYDLTLDSAPRVVAYKLYVSGLDYIVPPVEPPETGGVGLIAPQIVG